MNYIKSLFPWRWVLILILFLSVEYLLLFLPHFLITSIINLFTWIMVDITIGIGRRVEEWHLNIIGLSYLISLAVFLLWLSKNLNYIL